MKASEKCMAIIREFEGCRLKAYKCPAGIWTIGYGHTRKVLPGQTITNEEAENLLDQDLWPVEENLNRLGFDLNQNQYDALISFIFNVGWGHFSESTLLKKIRISPDHRDIPAEFKKWVKAGGKKLPGLVRRRKAEADLYTAAE